MSFEHVHRKGQSKSGISRSLSLRRKGQTAIEYLTTYGWAVLIIAVVAAFLIRGGFLGGQCPKRAAGFSGQDVNIQDHGFTSSTNLEMKLANTAGKDLNITNISVESLGTPEVFNQELSTGDTDTFTVSVSSGGISTGCYDEDVNVTYFTMSGGSNDIGPFTISGTLTGDFTQ